MEAGKWIMFAFLLGAVGVGFKTRTLKWYEFAVSGLFLVLLDGLVFDGQISRWVGQLGTNVQQAADGAAAGSVVFLDTETRARLRRFGRRMWAQRPAPLDYLLTVGLAFTTWVWWDLALPVGLAIFAAVLLGAVATAAALNQDPKDPDEVVSRDG
jgi:hypothetical protein